MTRLSLDGEVRVGFGRRGGSDLLGIDGDRLFLRCFRTYRFGPDEVVSIERQGATWFDAGVRIVHNRADYPRAMSFSCRGGSAEVFALLARAGFTPRGKGPAGRSSLLPAARVLVVSAVVYAIGQGLVRLLR
jgi:hypothetical protein